MNGSNVCIQVGSTRGFVQVGLGVSSWGAVCGEQGPVLLGVKKACYRCGTRWESPQPRDSGTISRGLSHSTTAMEGLGSRLGKGIFQEAREASLAAAFLRQRGDNFLSNCQKIPLLVFVSYFVSKPKREKK